MEERFRVAREQCDSNYEERTFQHSGLQMCKQTEATYRKYWHNALAS
jgi:hypothetical protein